MTEAVKVKAKTSKAIGLFVNLELLAKADAKAKEINASRAGLIRLALNEFLNK